MGGHLSCSEWAMQAYGHLRHARSMWQDSQACILGRLMGKVGAAGLSVCPLNALGAGDGSGSSEGTNKDKATGQCNSSRKLFLRGGLYPTL